MSWVVDGVMYHDYREYQQARIAHDARLAQAQARAVGDEVRRLQRRIAEREGEIAAVRNDLRRQAALNEMVQADMGALRRQQDLLAQIQRESEARLDERIDDMRADQELMADDLASLEEEQRRHGEEMRAGFEQVRGELRDGLAEAEQRMAEAERRLQGEIGRVASALDAERRARLDRQQGEVNRTHEQIAIVEERLNQLQPQVSSLALEEDVMLARNLLERSRTLLQQGDSTQALAKAEDAYVHVATLEQRVLRRSAELVAAKESMASWLTYTRSRLASAEVQRYFAREISRIEPILARWEERVQTGYDDYRRLEIMRNEDGEVFRRLESRLVLMVESAPEIKSMALDRKRQVDELVAQLSDLNGPMTDCQVSLADPMDRKSPMVVVCQYGRPTIRITIDLDGHMQLDGYGYDSNGACARRAEAIVASLASHRGLQEPVVDNVNRANPTPQAARETAPRWAGLSRELANLEHLT
ncbi:MAG: hypothetical protein AB7G62_00700 [Magnetospirillum sp.]